jgi:hypothetical protein
MAEELAKCPFCAGKAILHTNADKMPDKRAQYLHRWTIGCHGCGLLTMPFRSEREAVEFWQRRV